MTTSTLLRPDTPMLGEARPCHTVDDQGRTFCGADTKSGKPRHLPEVCEAEGHLVCATCVSLEALWYLDKEEAA